MIFIYLTVYVNKIYNSFRQLEYVIKFRCFRNGNYNIHVYGKVGEEKGEFWGGGFREYFIKPILTVLRLNIIQFCCGKFFF